ncbi:MAG TPA: FecR domain-containing protein [Polyangiaceae bacterium]
MSDEPRVEDLLAPLREPSPERSGRCSAVDRDRIVARMSAVAKSLPLERARRRRNFAIAAIAAAFAVTLGAAALRVFPDRPLGVTVVAGEVRLVGPATRGLAPGETARLSAEGDLTTSAHAEARLLTENGIDIEMFENTRLGLADLQPRSDTLHIDAGAVRCHVPRLAPKQTFSVVTPDAQVVVHGTVFRVDVRHEGTASRTSVRVEEGEVVVRHATGEVTLRASESWTHDGMAEAGTASPPVDAEANQNGEPPKASASPRTGGRRAPEISQPSPGTLDQETRLLRSALAAERSGDFAGAAASLELLVSRYPQSPLLPDARAALARVRMRRGGQIP